MAELTDQELMANFNKESFAAEPEASPMATQQQYGNSNPLPGGPFQSAQSPFGPPPPDGQEQPPATNEATPLRTLTLAASMLGENGQPVPTNHDELVQMFQENIDKAEQIIEQGNERNEQLKSSVRQTERRIQALQNMDPSEVVPGATIPLPAYKQLQASVAADRMQHIKETAEADTVEEAITKMQTYLAAGDTTAARTLINSMDPTKNTTFGVIQENLKKAAIIANAVERAKFDEDQESLVNSILTGITSIPESILLGSMFREAGNVDDGKGGYKSSWLRMFFEPGQDYQQQVRAIQGMTSEELSNYLPTLLKNIKNNATTLGLTDRGTIVGILQDFQNGISDEAAREKTAWHWMDVAGLIPFTGLARGAARTTELMMGIGVRKQAADRVAAAIDETVKNGASSTTRKFGITTDEIVEHSLPSAINPGKLPEEFTFGARMKTKLKAGTAVVSTEPRSIPRVQVSLSGEISDTMRAAEMVTQRIIENNNTYRHFTPEEVQVAVKNELDEVTRRVKSNIADYTVKPVVLPSGQRIHQIEAIINQPFATPEEAMGFLKDAGYGADITSAELRGSAKDIIPVKPAIKTADGKVYVAPRGTAHSEVLRLNPSLLEKNALDNSLDGFVDESGEFITRKEASRRHGAGDAVALVIQEAEQTPAAQEAIRKINEAAAKIKDGKPTAELEAARAEYNTAIRSFEASIIEDVSGQYFPKVTVDVGEYGFYTNPLNVPNQMYVSRWILNPSQTSDIRLFEQSTKAGQIHAKILKSVQRDLTKVFSQLNRTERTFLNQILLKGANMKRWFSDEEFRSIWERAYGRMPSDKVEGAYRQYKVNNDVEWLLRNSDVRTQYVIKGFEEVTMPSVASDPMIGKVFTDGGVPNDRIYDASNVRHYKKGELTSERMKELYDDGYVLVQTEELQKLHDGTRIRNFIVKKTDLETNPIRENILEYTQGGHRLYADKYFVKQARSFKQPDEASEVLERPNVFVTASNAQEGKLWASVMEHARIAVSEQNADAKFLDEKVFKGQRLKFPTGEEFLAGVDDGTYSLDHPFEALYDRELPSAYARTKEGAKFVEDEEPGFGGYYRTTGRLYYSKKGEHLRSVDGELAPTLDAFQAQANALYNVAKLSSFSDFKTSAINRWVDTFKQYLVHSGGTPSEIFNTAVTSPSLDKRTANMIEGQRASIRRVLNFRSEADLHYEQLLRTMHEWIAGESDNALRRELAKAPLWFQSNNPLAFLRGLAFDFKLGMWNPGQFFIQTSTMLSAASAAGWTKGLHGFASVPALFAYRQAMKHGVEENVLDLMAKRGMAELSGFSTEQEFKDFVRFASKSGFFDFGETHALINASHEAATFSLQSKANAFREAGRLFFYKAEQANRVMAMRIAWDEAVERFGVKEILDPKNFEAEEFIRGRAEQFSFNMSETSRASWQKGLLSIPTQFWAYNIRMLEAMVGKNFTGPQKFRLILSQLLMAGTAGIPMLGWISDYYNADIRGNAPSLQSDNMNEKNLATFQRGLLDRFVYEATGADVQIGQKWGTGDFYHQTIKEILGISEYGKKSFAEVAGGATFNIWYDVGDAVATSVWWMTNESGGNEVNLSNLEMQQMFRQISTINNVAFKAWFAKNYGIYQSVKGQTLISDLPRADAPFIALGFAPGELRDREAISAWREGREQSIKDSADFINARWRESLLQPDKMEQNGRIVNEFVNMLPVNERSEVLRRAHLDRDKSDYDRLLRLQQTDRIVDQYAKTNEQEEIDN